MSRYGIYRLAAAVLPYVPRRLGYLVFGWLGDLAYLAAPSSRRLLAGNISHITGLGPAEPRLRLLTRQAFRNLLWGYFELFRLAGRRSAGRLPLVTIDGEKNLRQATGGEAGAIFVFPHLGNLEVLSQVPLLFSDLDFWLVVGPMPDERIFGLMRQLRAAHGLRTIDVHQTRRLVRLLREGSNVVVAADVDSTDSGIVVDFFGRPAKMPDGAVRLALRFDAPLCIVHGWRESMRRPLESRLQVLPPVRFDRTSDPRLDVRNGVQRLVRDLEPIIAVRPEQWLAARKIWLET